MSGSSWARAVTRGARRRSGVRAGHACLGRLVMRGLEVGARLPEGIVGLRVVRRVVRSRVVLRMVHRLDLVGQNGLELDLLVVLGDGLTDVLAVLRLHEGHQLVGVLADDDGAEVAGHVVPGDAVRVLVVEDGQARLVVVFLQALDGHADVELGVDGTLALALQVVGLGLARSTNENYQ